MLAAVATPASEDIAVITRSLEAFNRRELTALVETIHPDAKIIPAAKPYYSPAGVTYHGRTGIESLVEAVLARAPGLRIEPHEFQSLGGRLLVSVSLTEEKDATRDAAVLYSITGGQIVRSEAFATEAEAREAAGRLERLTPRQRDVFRLLAYGLNAWEIADRLAISPDTVRTHVRNGLVKLGAKSRAQAVAIALTVGEIEL
jgi:DNA-binding CsgD family transcriptional regulator